jgi:hypothetical protein
MLASAFALVTPFLVLRATLPQPAIAHDDPTLAEVGVTQEDEPPGAQSAVGERPTFTRAADASPGDKPADAPRGGAILRARPGVPLVAFAAAGDAIYVVDARGDVRASLDGGRTFRTGRFPTHRSARASSFAATCAEGEADALGDIDPFVLLQNFGYVGENVWLDIDSTFFLRSSAGELFAFPYGTTGEAYLEFTPDSPAFWEPQWLNGLPRPDVRYPRTALTSRFLDDADEAAGADCADHAENDDHHNDQDESTPASVDDDDVDAAASSWKLTIAAADPRVALCAGPFGLERTDDGGRTWFLAEDDDVAATTMNASPREDLVLTADALSRAAPTGTPTPGVGASRLAAFRRMRARGPSFHEVMLGARERVGGHSDDGPSFVPRIDIVGGSMFADSRAVLDAVFLDSTFAGDADFVRQTAEVSTENGEDAAFVRSAPVVNPFVVLLLSWDLPTLFAPAASPKQRGALQETWADAERDVIDALRARDRVLEELAFHLPEDDDDFVVLLLELEEAEARITALSGARFPPPNGRAATALARLPATQPVTSVIEQAQRHLGVGDDRMAGFARARAWRPAMPTLVAAGTYVDTSLDEDDFLDEIGTNVPWVKKSANGRIVEIVGRLTWDLPQTLRAGADSAELLRLRRDVALDATAAYFERRRTQASLVRTPADRDEQLVVDELGSVLSAMTGGWFPDAENNRSPP